MDENSHLIQYGVDPENKLLYSKWKAPFNSEQYRACILHLIEVMKSQHIQLWLHESIRLHNLEKDDQIWTVEVMALFLAQSELKHIAIVRPEVEEALRIGKSMKERAYRIFGKIVGVEFFENIEDAKAWLVPKRLYYKLPKLHDSSEVKE